MNIKKAFQKTISEIRKDWRIDRNTPNDEYPKAMMTSQQEQHNTATVNCGGDWCSFSKELAQYVMDDERFRKFISDTGAKVTVEKFYRYSSPAYQIRINFPA